MKSYPIPRREQTIYQTEHNWFYLPIVRYLTVGYNKQRLTCLFDSIPPHIASAFKEILQKMHGILCQRIDYLKSYQPFLLSPTDDTEMFDFESDLWQQQNVCGYMKITYDPSSQEPLFVQMNDKLCEYARVSCENYSMQLAERMVPIPMPEVDFLFLLIDEAKNSTLSRTDRSEISGLSPFQ